MKPPMHLHRPPTNPQSPALRRRKAQTVSLGKRRKPVTLPALPASRGKP